MSVRLVDAMLVMRRTGGVYNTDRRRLSECLYRLGMLLNFFRGRTIVPF